MAAVRLKIIGKPATAFKLAVLANFIADCRLPIADCRLPIADCRLPIADLSAARVSLNPPTGGGGASLAAVAKAMAAEERRDSSRISRDRKLREL